MDVLLQLRQEYAAAFLDDIFIHYESLERHLVWLQGVLMELRWAGNESFSNSSTRKTLTFLHFYIFIIIISSAYNNQAWYI